MLCVRMQRLCPVVRATLCMCVECNQGRVQADKRLQSEYKNQVL